ncbi:EF-hand domain-containing protein [Streptomyces sp. NPDC126503]|uniref:EF-hand domain-containing protein n=1 Tax=Streptomyces sp. NPDC126503 TaxID=3155315 RepID=UPI003322F646
MADIASEKYGRAFDALDADKNGHLVWGDYQALVDRFITAYKLGKDDLRARALLTHFQMEWVELLRHAGVDGDRLDREQYAQASRMAAIDTSRLNVAEGGAHAMFDVIDVDGDNEINKDEFTRLLKDVWKVTDPTALDTFSRIDTDEDGVISRREFIRTIREYHFSTDPKAPGSILFGQI